MALVVLDASVVIGFLDSGDALHEPSRAALSAHRGDELVVPASVYAEVLVAPYRAGPEAVATIDAFVADLALRVEPLSAFIARAAAVLRARHTSLRLPDAYVLATAEDLEADAILTGDRGWVDVSPRVVLVSS